MRYAAVLLRVRYRDPLSGQWTKARYRAALHVPQERYVEGDVWRPLLDFQSP
jgi:hypothetical protein